MIAFLLGLGAGALTAVVTRLVESSRLAFGPFALYGNGALLILMVGAALSIYAAWCWVLRTGRPRRDLAFSVAGVHLGVGAGALPSLPALLFTGFLFVVPTAAVGYLVHWALSRSGPRPGATVPTLIVVAGLALAIVLPPVAGGLLVGPYVLAGARSTGAGAAGLGALLLATLLAAGLAVPLLAIG